MDTSRILILLHQRDDTFDSGDYLLKLLMKEWKEMGCAIQVKRGLRPQVRADLVIPHIDLTITPEAHRDLLQAYPHVINRGVVDISKSRISTNLVTRNSSYAGPVIVKTDRNYGGLLEQHLSARSLRGKWARVRRRLLGTLGRRPPRNVPWRSIQSMRPGDYPVFPSVRDVPNEVFENKNLVVEKFLPEIIEGEYCLRFYYFFGSADFNILLRCQSAYRGIIKGQTLLREIGRAFEAQEVSVPEEL